MISAAVLVGDARWEGRFADVSAVVDEAIAAAADEFPGLPQETVVSVALSNDGEVQVLNRDYRGQDKPTNVLSFPALEAADLAALKVGRLPAALPAGAEVALGDIILAYETVTEEARLQGKTLSDHLRHLLVHGFLHLLGYDHEAEDEAILMEATEVRILSSLGIADPYRMDDEISPT